MRLLFLNQYFPPDPAPTGALLREVADSLAAEGHTVDFVAANQDYRASHSAKQRGGRMLREFKALAGMLWTGLHRPRPDVVISCSSPPCLLVVATLLALWHRARSIHWAMDLYPEIAVALGEIRRGPLERIVYGIMGACYRACSVVVALDTDMAKVLARHGVRAVIQRPWVFQKVGARGQGSGERVQDSGSRIQDSAARADSSPLHPSSFILPPSKESPGFLEKSPPEVPCPLPPDPCPHSPWTWIYSGNLGRAHEWHTLLQAQAILESKDPSIRLLFQGGGPSWPMAKARAQELGLKNCHFQPYVAEEQLAASLMACQCCVVTQRPETQGLLWPSKLGMLLGLPLPLLWVGPVEGAVADSLATLPQAAAFPPGAAEAVAEWLLSLKRNGLRESPVVIDLAAHRDESLGKLRAIALSKGQARGDRRSGDC